MDGIFLGEIRLMSFNFPPKGWLLCQGQTLPVNQNQALFSLLGTTYGGDGVTTFRLPDLRGRVILGQGQSTASGANYAMGQVAGTESVALNANQIPAHQHAFSGTVKTADSADSKSPSNTYPAPPANQGNQYANGSANTTLGGQFTGNTDNSGGSQPHENRQPLMAMNYAIAITGIYPSRG
ncbi:tail fiber protein [Hymenobacter sp. DH14]|uniref:Tail fiber protein n=1 Tax=Hymenobacter cyanobacteriorum TaxID=2926463 RepID=A0A9X2AEM7_9BACT|nr:tail fiber protein [Hymenobacter cyanobacteriorum]MCI1186952.1 tail fiber protein [Hymenobacter cyanobacteriorum]